MGNDAVEKQGEYSFCLVVVVGPDSQNEPGLSIDEGVDDYLPSDETCYA